MPDLGIGEALAAFGLGDALGLGSLFGAGEAAAGALGGAAAGATGAGLGALPLLGAGAAAGLPLALSEINGTPAIGATAAGEIMPSTGALATGLATEPAFAGTIDPLAGLTTSNVALPKPMNIPTASPGVETMYPGGAIGPGTPTTAPAAPVVTGAAPAAPSAVTSIAPAGASPVDLASSGAATGGTTSGISNATPSASWLDKLSPSNIASSAVDSALKNPLGLAATGGLLATTLLNKPNTPSVSSTTGPMKSTADALTAQAPELMQHLTAGTLPAGMKASVDAATRDAKTRAISNAAANGQPTDPTRNTTLAAQLDAIDRQAVTTTAELGQKLLQTGLDETRLSSDVYSKLTSVAQAEDAATRDAIAKLAAALGGSSGGINLRVV